MTTEKQLPADSDILFLVCEMAREEARGKISLYGYIPAGKIVLESNATLPVRILVAFAFMVQEGVGVFKTSIEIQSPTGKPIPIPNLPDTNKETNKVAAILINYTNFPVESFGEFTLTLKLDENSYIRRIHLQKNPN